MLLRRLAELAVGEAIEAAALRRDQERAVAAERQRDDRRVEGFVDSGEVCETSTSIGHGSISGADPEGAVVAAKQAGHVVRGQAIARGKGLLHAASVKVIQAAIGADPDAVFAVIGQRVD